MNKTCCNYDQNCAKIIVQCGFVYIADDYGSMVKIEEKDFNNLMQRYKDYKKEE